MRAIAVAAALLLATACAPTVRTAVENFSDLPDDYVGQTISLTTLPAERAETLEWKAYRETFVRELEALGFQVTDSDDAAFAAQVIYDVSDPQRWQETISQPVYGTIGNRVTVRDGVVRPVPLHGIVGTTTSTITIIEYLRSVNVVITDVKNDAHVFEGSARSFGPCPILGQVIDEMAEAMFDLFPNGSGSVDIPAVIEAC